MDRAVIFGVVGIGLWCLATVVMAVTDRVLVRRERERLATMADDPARSLALQQLITARSRFASAVQRHEIALTSDQPVFATAEGESFDERRTDSGTDPGRSDADLSARQRAIEALDADRLAARERLLDAQRLWSSVRPGDQPDSRIDAWFGSGSMRAWNFGPIGHERFTIRLDHAVDQRCWVIVEVSRARVGFGLGLERQRLGLFSIRANARQLPELVIAGLSGREAAVRPGFVPTRTWRRERRMGPAKAANRVLLGQTDFADLMAGPDDATRATALAGLGYELGMTVDNDARLPPGPGLLTIATSGPSCLLGAWTGPSPTLWIRASSGHGVWQQ